MNACRAETKRSAEFYASRVSKQKGFRILYMQAGPARNIEVAVEVLGADRGETLLKSMPRPRG